MSVLPPVAAELLADEAEVAAKFAISRWQPLDTLGAFIAQLRQQSGVSQRTLHRALGIGLDLSKQLEAGRALPPKSYDTYLRMATLLTARPELRQTYEALLAAAMPSLAEHAVQTALHSLRVRRHQTNRQRAAARPAGWEQQDRLPSGTSYRDIPGARRLLHDQCGPAWHAAFKSALAAEESRLDEQLRDWVVTQRDLMLPTVSPRVRILLPDSGKRAADIGIPLAMAFFKARQLAGLGAAELAQQCGSRATLTDIEHLERGLACDEPRVLRWAPQLIAACAPPTELDNKLQELLTQASASAALGETAQPTMEPRERDASANLDAVAAAIADTPVSSSTELATVLARLIDAGELAPRTLLPSHTDFKARCGINRGTVQTARELLTTIGALEFVNQRCFVTAGPHSTVEVDITALVRTQQEPARRRAIAAQRRRVERAEQAAHGRRDREAQTEQRRLDKAMAAAAAAAKKAQTAADSSRRDAANQQADRTLTVIVTQTSGITREPGAAGELSAAIVQLIAVGEIPQDTLFPTRAALAAATRRSPFTMRTICDNLATAELLKFRGSRSWLAPHARVRAVELLERLSARQKAAESRARVRERLPETPDALDIIVADWQQTGVVSLDDHARIVAGLFANYRIPPDAPFPSPQALAERSGLRRWQTRRIVQLLRAAGLVRTRASHAWVAAGPHDDALDRLEAMINDPQAAARALLGEQGGPFRPDNGDNTQLVAAALRASAPQRLDRARAVARLLIDGRLPPASRFPTTLELSAASGLTKPDLRQLRAILHAAGLIHRQGAFGFISLGPFDDALDKVDTAIAVLRRREAAAARKHQRAMVTRFHSDATVAIISDACADARISMLEFARIIAARYAAGDIRPHSRFPNARAIAARSGIGNNRIARARRLLVTAGILVHQRDRSLYFSPAAQLDAPALLEASITDRERDRAEARGARSAAQDGFEKQDWDRLGALLRLVLDLPGPHQLSNDDVDHLRHLQSRHGPRAILDLCTGYGYRVSHAAWKRLCAHLEPADIPAELRGHWPASSRLPTKDPVHAFGAALRAYALRRGWTPRMLTNVWHHRRPDDRGRIDTATIRALVSGSDPQLIAGPLLAFLQDERIAPAAFAAAAAAAQTPAQAGTDQEFRNYHELFTAERALLTAADRAAPDRTATEALLANEAQRLDAQRRAMTVAYGDEFPGWDRTLWPDLGVLLHRSRIWHRREIAELATELECEPAALWRCEAGQGYQPSDIALTRDWLDRYPAVPADHPAIALLDPALPPFAAYRHHLADAAATPPEWRPLVVAMFWRRRIAELSIAEAAVEWVCDEDFIRRIEGGGLAASATELALIDAVVTDLPKTRGWPTIDAECRAALEWAAQRLGVPPVRRR